MKILVCILSVILICCAAWIRRLNKIILGQNWLISQLTKSPTLKERREAIKKEQTRIEEERRNRREELNKLNQTKN